MMTHLRVERKKEKNNERTMKFYLEHVRGRVPENW